MGPASRCFKASLCCMALLILALSPRHAVAQTCQTSTDMDATLRTAITNAADRYFGMAARGDIASLRQNSIPSLPPISPESKTPLKSANWIWLVHSRISNHRSC